MTEQRSDRPVSGGPAPEDGGEDGAVAVATVIEADDLVEEITIDGMCGVY